ncbi:hypothetical protein PTSG_12429 [Salpingoeca rosetta]|uniref:NmrA-like domain-containing protein n=1 Tax=Salpingoeca rosetta (strain ATCC 50818 / BSB-021) TaxID=946362 RepID=F2UCK6_SALR5|nr:uncharacterized protein PTSG_12429 [Salpingoeca rosetta]EGD74313.1 hypothetical protein PTSG_12429 [Salpingoeca rosetta]|eukprot:XP_004993213.1 hypothetical protein PTSG_12429 [Salpingoeca rosetta]
MPAERVSRVVVSTHHTVMVPPAVVLGAVVLALAVASSQPPLSIKPILVIGGTGIQGKLMAALEELHGLGFRELRTVSRNASSARARELSSTLGVHVIEGSLESATTLSAALQGCAAAFLVTFTDFHDDEGERRTGRALLDAAHAAHVPHIVWSSGDRTGVRWLDSKADLEQYANSLAFESVLSIRSGFFFENLVTKGGQQRFSVDIVGAGLGGGGGGAGGGGDGGINHDHDGVAGNDSGSKKSSGNSGGSSCQNQRQQQQQQQEVAVVEIGLYSPFPKDQRIPMHAASDVGLFAARSITDTLRHTQSSPLTLRLAQLWQWLKGPTWRPRFAENSGGGDDSGGGSGGRDSGIDQRESFVSSLPSSRARQRHFVRVVGDVITGAEYCASVESIVQRRFSHSDVAIACQYHVVSPDTIERQLPGPAGAKIADLYRRVLDGQLDHLHTQHAILSARESAPAARTLAQWLEDEGARVFAAAVNTTLELAKGS